MKIELKEISIRDIVDGYKNNDEEGVVGFNGKLDIRPKYQRNFIYKDKQRDAVIKTVIRDFPLNVMYWVKSTNGTYEVMDGQQRTISFCEYVVGRFSLNYRFFHNLEEEEKEQILNYKTMIYFCEGTDKEKLDWFETINIAGEKLTKQELKNAIYSGTWVSDAKRYFSRRDCAAYDIASGYMTGTPIRQDYLETAISWINNGEIAEYMSIHHHEPNANELWLYFQCVINWSKAIFPKWQREMQGVPWGLLYNEFKDKQFDTKQVAIKVARLMEDEDVTNKKGIYQYIINGEEKYLNIREFSPNQKREAYERQQGVCIVCEEHFELDEMDADHITPWHEGGKTLPNNCQMLCKDDNRRKSGR